MTIGERRKVESAEGAVKLPNRLFSHIHWLGQAFVARIGPSSFVFQP